MRLSRTGDQWICTKAQTNSSLIYDDIFTIVITTTIIVIEMHQPATLRVHRCMT